MTHRNISRALPSAEGGAPFFLPSRSSVGWVEGGGGRGWDRPNGVHVERLKGRRVRKVEEIGRGGGRRWERDEVHGEGERGEKGWKEARGRNDEEGAV